MILWLILPFLPGRSIGVRRDPPFSPSDRQTFVTRTGRSDVLDSFPSGVIRSCPCSSFGVYVDGRSPIGVDRAATVFLFAGFSLDL